MDEPMEDLGFESLLCDEVGDELLRQLVEEEAAEKTQKGDFTIASSSDTTEAAEEEQKKSVSKLETNSCDLSNTVDLGVQVTELGNPPAPTILLYFSQAPVSIQPILPQPQKIKRPRSPLPPPSVPQQDPQFPESNTQCPEGRDQAPSRPPPSGTESPDTRLPLTPKKRERTKYNADQLEILEALFHEDSFPDVEKKKFIADSLGVTAKKIAVWFQNRRSREKKEDALYRKPGAGQSRFEYAPHHKLPSSKGASSLSTRRPPARSSRSSRSSPGQSRVRPAHTSPLNLDALAGGSTLARFETLSLPIDTSKRSSTYHLQISYSAIQPDTSLPGIANLTPKPPNSNLTSCLIFGPGGDPTGVVTIAVTGFQSSDQHAGTAACQSHRDRQGPDEDRQGPDEDCQGPDEDRQGPDEDRQGPDEDRQGPDEDRQGPDEDRQPPSSVSLPRPQASLFQESSHENSQCPLLSEAPTSTATILPPVSALPTPPVADTQLLQPQVEDAPPEELLQPQVPGTALLSVFSTATATETRGKIIDPLYC